MVLDGVDGQLVDGRVEQLELGGELEQPLALASGGVEWPAFCGEATGSDDILELVGGTVSVLDVAVVMVEGRLPDEHTKQIMITLHVYTHFAIACYT